MDVSPLVLKLRAEDRAAALAMPDFLQQFLSDLATVLRGVDRIATFAVNTPPIEIECRMELRERLKRVRVELDAIHAGLADLIDRTDTDINNNKEKMLRDDPRALLTAYLGNTELPKDLLPINVDKLAQQAFGSTWKLQLEQLSRQIERRRSQSDPLASAIAAAFDSAGAGGLPPEPSEN